MSVLQRGKIAYAQEPEVSGIRELARADLNVLLAPRPSNFLQSIKDSHHRIARAVAAGLRNDEIASLCGVSHNRVSMLRSDPAFVELIAHYRGLITAEYVRSVDNFMEVATANMLKAETMLSDKIDAAIEANEPLPTRDLIAITADRADRFGYGKTQKNLNFNVDFAAKLDLARKRSATAREIDNERSPTLAIDHDPAAPPALSSPQGQRSFRRV